MIHMFLPCPKNRGYAINAVTKSPGFGKEIQLSLTLIKNVMISLL